MRDSKVGSLKHKHLMGYEDSRSQNQKGNSFVIREVPIQRISRGAQCAKYASSDLPRFGKGKSFGGEENVTDYDTPELVVFLQEDRQQFLKDIGIEREVALTKGKRLIKDGEFDKNRMSCLFDPDMESNSESYEATSETMSSNSNGSESASRHPCIKDDAIKKYVFGNLMVEKGEEELDSGDYNSTDHPTENTTSQTLKRVINQEADFSRSFFNWQSDSFMNTIGSRMEFPHCAECQQFPETSSTSRPQRGNSRSVRGSGRSLDRQGNDGESYSYGVGPLSDPKSNTGPATKSGCASYHQSNDSISSAHSFTFPM